jgi:hypothetical protein
VAWDAVPESMAEYIRPLFYGSDLNLFSKMRGKAEKKVMIDGSKQLKAAP